ncbi:MAG: SLC13 family permease [Nitratireductor sp.]|nr:SLC13 family permease [Nitratireductor sp.]
MWATFAIITFSVIAFAIDKWSMEYISLITLVLFLLLFSIVPDSGVEPFELVQGFANPALVTVISLLMIGQGLFNTDALDGPSRMLSRFAGGGVTGTLLIILGAAAFISAFLNNTPVVVMFIPIITAIAAQRNFDAAKGLMPLSFICILGGMTTLIGSSTNLLVANVARGVGVEIGFFDFLVPGAIVAGVGMLYVIFVMPKILSQRPGMADRMRSSTGKQFVSQIEISEGHPLTGIESQLGMFPALADITVRMVVRRQVPIMPPFEDVTLSVGDILIVASTREALTKALARGAANVPSHPEDEPSEAQRHLADEFHLAEVVVAPGSRYVGRTIQGANIRFLEGVVVMGVQRKTRMQHKAFSEIRLEPGDTLLVGGSMDAISSLRTKRDLILLEWSAEAVPLRRYAWRAIAIFASVVFLAATGLLPIMVSALLGVFAMIASRCLNIAQAARSFDSRIFMLVAAALASAIALEKTGGAVFLANSAVTAMDGFPPSVILSLFFLAVAIITNFLSNNATAVLFTPIAIQLATKLGVAVEPFVVAVIFAANAAFSTPVGYQTNLLVLGPGHYRFVDFVKAGTPLVIIVWLTYSFVGPWYYGL